MEINDSLKLQVASFNKNTHDRYGRDVLVLNDHEVPSLSVILNKVEFRVKLEFLSKITDKMSIYNSSYKIILINTPGKFNSFITSVKDFNGFVGMIDLIYGVTGSINEGTNGTGGTEGTSGTAVIKQ